MNGSRDSFKPKDVKTFENLSKEILNNTYSLSIFKDNKRTNKNFQASKFVGLDFDNGRTVQMAIDTFKKYKCIIATTRNHQKEKNGVTAERFRVILELSEVVNSAEDYKATVMSLLELYPDADKQCSDPARMFYESKNVVFLSKEGETVPVTKYNAVPVSTPPLTSLAYGKISKLTDDFINNGAGPGDWNGRLFKAAVDLNEQGYSYEAAIEALTNATVKFQGELDESDIKTIDSAYDREPKHPPRATQSCFNFKKTSDLNKDGKTVEWLVDGYLIRGGISIFAGSPKSGKSTLARQLTLSVLKGVPFLDREVAKGKVLYLALEEAEDLVKQQLEAIGITPDMDLMLHVGPLGTGNRIDNLKEAIDTYKADLVIIDTLLLMVLFQNINDYNEVYQKMSELRNVARGTGSHILCLHHQNKGENRGTNSILGSSAIQGAVDGSTVFNIIPGRSSYRKLNSSQRGGKPFVDKELKYISEMDIYEISVSQDGEF